VLIETDYVDDENQPTDRYFVFGDYIDEMQILVRYDNIFYL